jgi:hypothetical protein
MTLAAPVFVAQLLAGFFLRTEGACDFFYRRRLQGIPS